MTPPSVLKKKKKAFKFAGVHRLPLHPYRNCNSFHFVSSPTSLVGPIAGRSNSFNSFNSFHSLNIFLFVSLPICLVSPIAGSLETFLWEGSRCILDPGFNIGGWRYFNIGPELIWLQYWLCLVKQESHQKNNNFSAPALLQYRHTRCWWLEVCRMMMTLKHTG